MRQHAGLAALLAITVATPTLSGGGFDTASRSTFVVLAGLCLLVAGSVDVRAVRGALQYPAALTLAVLSVVSIASVAWTVGTESATLRWGLVIAGYTSVAITAAMVARVIGPWPIAGGIAVLAVVEAVIGLGAVAHHSLPDAERLVRTWRPGGTFEYQPALATLELGALPIFERAMARGRPLVAGGAAGGLVLAGATIALSGSRLGIVLAIIVLLALMLRRPAGKAAVAGAALAVIGALLAPVILGGSVGGATPGAGTTGEAELFGLAAAVAIGCALARSSIGPRRWRWTVATSVVAVAIAGALALTVSRYPTAPPVSRSAVRLVHRKSDLTHGRTHEWAAAVDTWFDHPLLGAGADAYFAASLSHQTVAVSEYAHDLPLEFAAELGVAGLILGLAIYATSAWTIVRVRRDPAIWLLAPFAAAFLVFNLFDWTWHLAGLGATWAAAIGALSGVEGGPVRFWDARPIRGRRTTAPWRARR